MNTTRTPAAARTGILSALNLSLMLCALLAQGALNAATYTWTGAAGDQNWFNSANWSGGTVPLPADTVTINAMTGPILMGVSATITTFNIGDGANASITFTSSTLNKTGGAQPVIGRASGTAFITLQNSTWTLAGNNYIGNTTNGAAFLGLYGSSTITNLGSDFGLALQVASVGVVTLNDNSTITTTGRISIGFRGTGTFIMNDNSRASSSGLSTAGIMIGGDGNAAARGWAEIADSAYMSTSGSAVIGSTGTGTLIMTDSGSFTANTVVIADTGHGEVALSDNALLRAGGILTVGGSGAGSLTLNNGGLVQAGSGTITLASAASATGLLEITGATAGSITGTNGTSPVTIIGGAGDARVVFSHGDANYIFANNLAGSLSVEHNGGGLTTLTGASDYTGGTIVRGGTLAGTSANLRGSITADAGGTLLFDQTSAGSFSGTLTGAGTLAKTGAAALTLDSAGLAAFTGQFSARTGTLALDFSALGDGATISNGLAIAHGTVIALDTGAGALAWNTSFASDITGGTLLKTGAGSLALAINQGSVVLAVNQGSVTLAPGSTLDALTVGTGAAFAGAGTISGNVSVDHATFSIVHGGGPLVVGGDFDFADSTLAIGLFNAADDVFSVAGAAVTSGVNTIDLTPGMSGTYTLGGLASLDTATITIGGVSQAGTGARQVATSAASGSDLLIFFEADISRRLAWTGSSSANWNINDENWTGPNDTKTYAALDTVVFDADAANRAITLNNTVRVSDIIVTGSEDYTFAGSGGIISSTAIVTEAGNPDNLTDVTGKLVKSGNGSLTFANTGSNNFSGGIDINGGALVFNNAAQLGTGGAAITFSGGTLNSLATATLAAPIAITAASAIETPNTVSLTLAGHVSGNGSLEKTGGGSLILSGENTHTGPVTISGGTLATRAGNLRGSVVNNASLVLNSGDDADDTFASAISGGGSLVKTGSATLAFTGTATASTITLSQGALSINEHAALAATSAFSITPGAQLIGTGAFSAPSFTNAGSIKVGRAANPYAPHGVMTLTGNYTGSGDAKIRLDMSLNASGVMEYDRFIINGDATGSTRVSLQEQPSADRLRGNTSLLPSFGDMLSVSGSSSLLAFMQEGVVEFGGGQYQWVPALNNGAGGWRALVAEPVSAIGMLDAAALLIGKASFASLDTRLHAARETNRSREKQFWVAGLQRSEKRDPAHYDRYDPTPAARANTQGIQAGIDWIAITETNFAFIFGLFTDYAKSDMSISGLSSRSTATSAGAGIYGSWIVGGWHVDALLRTGSEKYEITAARVAPFSTRGYSWGGQLSAGYKIALAKKLSLEPSARLLYQTHNIKDATDAANRSYSVDSADTKEGRLGFRLNYDGTWKKGLKYIPYLYASWLYDFGGKGRLRVSDELFSHNHGGGGAEFGTGILLEVRRNIAIQAGFFWLETAATQGATATLGIAIAW